MVPLVPKTNVVLVTNNVLRSDWLFACNATLSNIDGVTRKIWYLLVNKVEIYWI